jgi:uncharacterized sulfatase
VKRPNILLITSDQHHWQTLGCMNPEVRTPHLDHLAEQGTLFTRAYCPNPTCTPTRASIITGKYPSQHGGWTLGTKLPESEPTLGNYLQDAGYRTALVGKAHFQQTLSSPAFPSLESRPLMQDLDYWRAFRGPFYGFGEVDLARHHGDEPLVGQHYAIWLEERGLTNWREHFRPPTGTTPAQRHRWSLPAEFHMNTWIADRTNARLAEYQRQGEPFFLWASFFDPHPPYLVSPPWDTMYDPARLTVPAMTPGEQDHLAPHFAMTQQRDPDFSAWDEPGGHALHGCHSHLQDRAALARDIAVYYGMTSFMDEQIGVILAQLDRLGLADDTLVVFTTDHGHLFGQHGLNAKGPFLYDDLLRLPFMVRWPGRVAAGRRSADLQSLVDLAPTFLAAAGVPIPDDMTGLNQLPAWRGQAPAPRRHVVAEFRHQPTTIHQRTYIDARYKLTVYFERPWGELFDLEADPGETRNRWADPAAAALRDELHVRLLEAELAKEERVPVALEGLPQKSPAMYLKELTRGAWTLRHMAGAWQLTSHAEPARNRWGDAAVSGLQAQLVRELLFARMGREPLWMPRVAGA